MTMGSQTGLAHVMPLVDIGLNCGHVVKFREDTVPTPGFEILCVRCNAYKHRPFPLEIGPDGMPVLREFMWLCSFRKSCNQGRSHKLGRDPRGAYAGARRHSLSNPGHEVWIVTPLGCVRDRWTVGTALFDTTEEVFKDAGVGD